MADIEQKDPFEEYLKKIPVEPASDKLYQKLVSRASWAQPERRSWKRFLWFTLFLVLSVFIVVVFFFYSVEIGNLEEGGMKSHILYQPVAQTDLSITEMGFISRILIQNQPHFENSFGDYVTVSSMRSCSDYF